MAAVATTFAVDPAGIALTAMSVAVPAILAVVFYAVLAASPGGIRPGSSRCRLVRRAGQPSKTNHVTAAAAEVEEEDEAEQEEVIEEVEEEEPVPEEPEEPVQEEVVPEPVVHNKSKKNKNKHKAAEPVEVVEEVQAAPEPEPVEEQVVEPVVESKKKKKNKHKAAEAVEVVEAAEEPVVEEAALVEEPVVEAAAEVEHVPEGSDAAVEEPVPEEPEEPAAEESSPEKGKKKKKKKPSAASLLAAKLRGEEPEQPTALQFDYAIDPAILIESQEGDWVSISKKEKAQARKAEEEAEEVAEEAEAQAVPEEEDAEAVPEEAAGDAPEEAPLRSPRHYRIHTLPGEEAAAEEDEAEAAAEEAPAEEEEEDAAEKEEEDEEEEEAQGDAQDAEQEGAEEEEEVEDDEGEDEIDVPFNARRNVRGQRGATLNLIQEKCGVQPIRELGGTFYVKGPKAGRLLALQAIATISTKGYCLLSYADPKESSLDVQVGKISTLIGPKGSIINKIRDAFGVEIKIPEQAELPSNKNAFVPVFVGGNSQGVDDAIQVLGEIAEHGFSPLTHPGYSREEIELDKFEKGFVIGKAGAEIRTIGQTYKVKVDIQDDRPSIIMGLTKDVEGAARYIKHLLAREDVAKKIEDLREREEKKRLAAEAAAAKAAEEALEAEAEAAKEGGEAAEAEAAEGEDEAEEAADATGETAEAAVEEEEEKEDDEEEEKDEQEEEEKKDDEEEDESEESSEK